MALTKAEQTALLAGEGWDLAHWWGRSVDDLAPDARVARLRGVTFSVAGTSCRATQYPVPDEVEAAHQALVDVAKWLGFRDDRGERAELEAHDKYQLAQENDPQGLRRLAVDRVHGRRGGLSAVRWRPSMLEGG